MLSFLKEDSAEDNSSQGQQQNISTAAQNSSHCESEVNGEYLESIAGEKPVKRTTAILGGVVTIGAIVLFFMIKQATPIAIATANEDQMAIDTAFAQLSSGETVSQQIDSIVKKFYDFSNVPQLEVKWLNKNPFVHVSKSENNDSILDDSQVSNSNQNRKDEAIKTLSVDGVMNISGTHCCMIDGELLYKGDVYKEYEILEISNESIVVLKNGKKTLIKIINDN